MAYYGEAPPERGTFSDLRYMKCSGQSRGETQGAQVPLSQGLDDSPPPLIWRSGSATEMVRISRVKVYERLGKSVISIVNKKG